MGALVTVLVPVWARPHRVQPLLDSIKAAGDECDVLFVCSPDDADETAAIEAAGCDPLIVGWPAGVPGDYARKINTGAQATATDWLLTAADDLRFHPGWFTEALAVHDHTGALVIGTNDLHNPAVTSGGTATHLLVHRTYLDRAVVDQPGNVMCEAYRHNCVDSELVETAKQRDVWAFAAGSHVEHLHPVFGGAPNDLVYARGRSGHAEDRRLFLRRRRLWLARPLMARR